MSSAALLCLSTMFRLLGLILAALMGFGLPVQATSLTAQTRHLNLLPSLTYLEDPSGRLTLAEVISRDAQFQSWMGGGSKLNAGFTPSAYWVKLTLQREAGAPADWLLEVDYPRLHELDFFGPADEVIRTGSDRSVQSRPFFDRFFVFPIRLTEQPQTYYLRATSRYALTLPLNLWSPNAYQAQQLRFHALQFLYYGGLVVLAIYGLVIFLGIRDGRFAIYSAYIITAGMGVLSSNGYGRLFLWPEQPQFDEIAQSFFLSQTAFFAVWFARRLMQTDERPWLGKMLMLSQLLFGLTCVMTLLQLVYPHLLLVTNQLLMLNSMVMGLLVTLAGFKAYARQQSGIRFFLAGWVVLWLGVCVAALRAFGWLPTNGLTSYAVQITTAIEMLLVALALGELLREEHQAYTASQAEALSANRALLEMSQASEEKLRQAVKERTEQLEHSLQEEKNLREQYVRIGSMISHEFRTPLSIIHSQASLMRKEYDKGIDNVLKRLEAIGSASQRLRLMFDKWLHSDSLNETLETLAFKRLDLGPWIHRQMPSHQHLLTQHKLVLALSSKVREVLADEYHLDLVLSNLIDNATKYAPADSTIIIDLREKPGFTGLCVSDQGPGIAQEVQEKVFREFFRVTPESQVRGVGLGLSIVQRIVKAHGGHVELISTLGHGATFCVWLRHPGD